MEDKEQHDLSPEADSALDKSESSSRSDEERQKLLETLQLAEREHEEWQETHKLVKQVADLERQLDEMIADPSSNASPYLAGEFTRLLKVIGDSKSSERDVRAAEFRAQMWLVLHASWKARQMDEHNATRADKAARNLTRATWMLAAATIAVVLATIGLIIATVVQHH